MSGMRSMPPARSAGAASARSAGAGLRTEPAGGHR